MAVTNLALAVVVSGVKRLLSVVLVVKPAAVTLHPPAAGVSGKGLPNLIYKEMQFYDFSNRCQET